MLVKIANPIYDTVFKYMLEDDRVARILLSALLKKEVVGVQLRPYEYSNVNREALSLFRIDFGARVLDEDGKERLMLVEIQKTWLETETLRFRQYLGAQYGLKSNIDTEGERKGFAPPMVAVYILGHTIGQIEPPVLYVRHRYLDYDGVEVEQHVPDKFVESLTHDCIFVQLPKLSGRMANRLERVMSVFDQTQRDTDNRQFMHIEDNFYDGDDDMECVVRRLQMAAADYNVRMDMNVEDEFFIAIENRDYELKQRDKILAEKDAQISEKDAQISEKDAQISENRQLLRSMVNAMQNMGMDMDAIAKSIGKSKDSLLALLSSPH